MSKMKPGLIGGLVAAGAAVVVGSVVGYIVATNPELKARLGRGARDAYETSKLHSAIPGQRFLPGNQFSYQ